DDLIHIGWIDLRARESRFDRNTAQVGGADAGKTAVEGADGGAGGAHNHHVGHVGSLLLCLRLALAARGRMPAFLPASFSGFARRSAAFPVTLLRPLPPLKAPL